MICSGSAGKRTSLSIVRRRRDALDNPLRGTHKLRPAIGVGLRTGRAQRGALHDLRRLVLAVGVLFIGAQVADLAHMAVAVHARCAEHGEAIDLADLGASPTPAVQLPGGSDAALVAVGGDSDGAAQHQHCASLACHRSPATSPGAATGCTAKLFAREVPALVCTEVRLAASALILLAPKASPPA